MLRIAFASTDQQKVDLHFGAADRLVLFDVEPGRASLVGIGEFIKAEMKGSNKDKGLPRELQGVAHLPSQPYAPAPEDILPPPDKPPEDKVIAKLDFLKGCAAVYAASIGASSIRRLMALDVQPIIVDNGHEIMDLLNEVSFALHYGGLAWVDRAVARQEKSPERFDSLADGTWDVESTALNPTVIHQLITSMDDLA